MVERITDEMLAKLPEKGKNRILAKMQKYGNNAWWNADDLRILAYFQLKEETLMVTFDEFHEGVEMLLGRPVWTHEFGINIEGLIEEAEKAFTLVQSGGSTETTPEYKARKTTEMLEELRNFAEKNNKEVIVI